MIALVALSCAPMAGFAAADGARKSGEWEISVTVTGQSTNTNKFCIDAGSDDIAETAGGGIAQSGCEEIHTESGGGTVNIRSICKQGNSTVTMTATLSGDLQSAYEGEVTKHYSPPLYGRTEIKSMVKGHYLGACP